MAEENRLQQNSDTGYNWWIDVEGDLDDFIFSVVSEPEESER